MIRNRLMKNMVWILLFVCFGSARILLAQDKPDRMIHVDIPVVLKNANVVFNMDHLAFAGDLPVGINYIALHK